MDICPIKTLIIDGRTITEEFKNAERHYFITAYFNKRHALNSVNTEKWEEKGIKEDMKNIKAKYALLLKTFFPNSKDLKNIEQQYKGSGF